MENSRQEILTYITISSIRTEWKVVFLAYYILYPWLSQCGKRCSFSIVLDEYFFHFALTELIVHGLLRWQMSARISVDVAGPSWQFSFSFLFCISGKRRLIIPSLSRRDGRTEISRLLSARQRQKRRECWYANVSEKEDTRSAHEKRSSFVSPWMSLIF